MTEDKPQNSAKLPPAETVINGVSYMTDSKGGLTPAKLVKPQHVLQDAAVREILGDAIQLSDDVSTFKRTTAEKIRALTEILAERYQAKRGGTKGNLTLISYCGTMKVTVSVAETFDFGPELQVAKALVDECLNEWSSDSRPELKAIIARAFNTDKGAVNRSEIIKLMKLEIDDPRWKEAVEAMRDAMRETGKSRYIRCYRRSDSNAAWEPIVIDLAKA